MGLIETMLARDVLLLNSRFTTNQLSLIVKIDSKQAICPGCHALSHRRHSQLYALP
ncbi:MAG: hypothetical protein K0S80_5107 [Neobacillus sp.]|nr:hypothetical protein [Neobacillus sp.]